MFAKTRYLKSEQAEAAGGNAATTTGAARGSNLWIGNWIHGVLPLRPILTRQRWDACNASLPCDRSFGHCDNL